MFSAINTESTKTQNALFKKKKILKVLYTYFIQRILEDKVFLKISSDKVRDLKVIFPTFHLNADINR